MVKSRYEGGIFMKSVMTGNQAIARGFWEAGGRLAASYPGSPTVEMLESLKEYDEIYSEFSVNEKVALEVAMGASFYGARAMASMKHVGINIAADPLMTFTQTKINGGFVLVSGDDPGMASSQNEQDNRIFGKFANMGILYPGNSQEAKDYMKIGLEMSENFQMPILLDITSKTGFQYCLAPGKLSFLVDSQMQLCCRSHPLFPKHLSQQALVGLRAEQVPVLCCSLTIVQAQVQVQVIA